MSWRCPSCGVLNQDHWASCGNAGPDFTCNQERPDDRPAPSRTELPAGVPLTDEAEEARLEAIPEQGYAEPDINLDPYQWLREQWHPISSPEPASSPAEPGGDE